MDMFFQHTNNSLLWMPLAKRRRVIKNNGRIIHVEQIWALARDTNVMSQELPLPLVLTISINSMVPCLNQHMPTQITAGN